MPNVVIVYKKKKQQWGFSAFWNYAWKSPDCLPWTKTAYLF